MTSETASEPVMSAFDLDVEDGRQNSVSQESGENKEMSKEGNGSVPLDVTAGAAVDPSMPLNWPLRKKILNMAIPSIMCFVV
jgi:hypothetical protein